MCDQRKVLTLSRGTSLLYRNQSNDLVYKSMDWYLYDRDLRHERVNSYFQLEPLLQVLTISNLWHATSRFEPVENLNSDCAEWNFAVVKTTSPRRWLLSNYTVQTLCSKTSHDTFSKPFSYLHGNTRTSFGSQELKPFVVYITFLHSIMTSPNPCSFLWLC